MKSENMKGSSEMGQKTDMENLLGLINPITKASTRTIKRTGKGNCTINTEN